LGNLHDSTIKSKDYLKLEDPLNLHQLQMVQHLENSHNSSGVTITIPDTLNESSLNSKDLHRYLRKIPDNDLNYFVTCLLPKDSAIDVIKDIRRSDFSKMDKISKICKAFLNEKGSSWTKVYDALKEAECDGLADIIEACFLPV